MSIEAKLLHFDCDLELPFQLGEHIGMTLQVFIVSFSKSIFRLVDNNNLSGYLPPEFSMLERLRILYVLLPHCLDLWHLLLVLL